MDRGGVRGGGQGTHVGQRDRRDERRLHLRAYNRWTSLLDRRACPLSADLAPGHLAEFAPSSLVLDYTGADKPSVRQVGDRLAGALLGDGGALPPVEPEGSLLGRVAALCGRVLAQRSPVSFEGELAQPRSGVILYRGILLPFASSAGEIDLIHAVVTWTRRSATTNNPAGLDQANLAAAAPQRREPLLDWADGPSAGEDAAELEPG